VSENVFDDIAPGWYNFRHWSIFRHELEALAGRWRGGKLLNIGCAHGPDFLPFRQGFQLCGIDSSPRMLEYARKYAAKFAFAVELKEADAASLPYPDAGFDWAISVATYHHLESEEHRLKALQELRRVLKPGGEAFITVWNRRQPRFWLKPKDIAVPWKTKGKVLYRHYHLFSRRELEGLVKKAGLEVLESFSERSSRRLPRMFPRNICLLVKKVAAPSR